VRGPKKEGEVCLLSRTQSATDGCMEGLFCVRDGVRGSGLCLRSCVQSDDLCQEVDGFSTRCVQLNHPLFKACVFPCSANDLSCPSSSNCNIALQRCTALP
jgi:hypothetical protein